MGETSLRANSALLRAIGPRLYPDASTGVIELVSNSYDADATAVRIACTPENIIVADNGYGMNEFLLVNFFTLGKSIKPPSKLGRPPIGQFGIGKFAMLAMANKFDVYCAYRHEDGHYEYLIASFDGGAVEGDTLLEDITIPILQLEKADWETQAASAGVPLSADMQHSMEDFDTGVIIVLKELRSAFSDAAIRAKLVERLSHTFKNQFDVYVNAELAEERYIHGARYIVDLETPYGPVSGEVIAAPDTYKLKDLVGVRVQVRGRMVKRELFGTELYDFETSRQMTGYIDAEFLNDFITPDRNDFIDTPPLGGATEEDAVSPVQALKNAMEPLLMEIIDKENLNRTNNIAQQQSKMLNRAVKQVTAVLREFPNLSFPETALSDLMPVELSSDPQKSEVVAELEPDDAQITANITAATADMDKIINAIQKAAEELRLSDGLPEEENMNSYSDIVDAISNMLGDDAAPLVEDINATLTGRLLEERDLDAARHIVTERIISSITKFVRERLEEQAAGEGLLSDLPGDGGEGNIPGNPTMIGGRELGLGNEYPGRSSGNRLRIRPPVVGQVIPVEKPLQPQPPDQSDSVLPTQVNPKEEGNDQDAAMADMQNFVAVTIEHLGPDGPASLLAEGFGYSGTMIYVNADHHVYQEMGAVRAGYLSFYIATIIVDEVLGLQDIMSHREKTNIKAELLKQMMLRDRKMLFRK